jgi:hypothetical protein
MVFDILLIFHLLQDAAMVVHAKSCQQMSEGQSSVVPGGTLDFQELQMRVIAIEKAVIEKERLVMVSPSQ